MNARLTKRNFEWNVERRDNFPRTWFWPIIKVNNFGLEAEAMLKSLRKIVRNTDYLVRMLVSENSENRVGVDNWIGYWCHVCNHGKPNVHPSDSLFSQSVVRGFSSPREGPFVRGSSNVIPTSPVLREAAAIPTTAVPITVSAPDSTYRKRRDFQGGGRKGIRTSVPPL